MYQLETPLEVLTPLGKGWCYFIGDGGDDIEWQVFINKAVKVGGLEIIILGENLV